jgi:hypothetical protein
MIVAIFRTGSKFTTNENIVEHRYMRNRAVGLILGKTGCMWWSQAAFREVIVTITSHDAWKSISIYILLKFWTEKFDGNQIWEAKENISSEAY